MMKTAIQSKNHHLETMSMFMVLICKLIDTVNLKIVNYNQVCNDLHQINYLIVCQIWKNQIQTLTFSYHYHLDSNLLE